MCLSKNYKGYFEKLDFFYEIIVVCCIRTFWVTLDSIYVGGFMRLVL